MLEAIALCEEIGGNRLEWRYNEQNRKGDHIWWISDVGKFRSHYPAWEYHFTLRDTLEQLFESSIARLPKTGVYA
jgi:CDP-paratose 2-epimerase